MTPDFIQQNFVTPEIAKALKELGFDERCLAIYSDLEYPIGEHGDTTKRSLCLYIDCQTARDEIKMLWIENEEARYHWEEGTYTDGWHSRCEIVGHKLPAPLWHQAIAWLRSHGIYILETLYGNSTHPLYDVFDNNAGFTPISNIVLDIAILKGIEILKSQQSTNTNHFPDPAVTGDKTNK